MKRRFFSLLTLFAAVIAACLTLTACKSSFDKYEAHLSEVRTDVFIGETERVKVTAVTGRRENPFLIDGQTGEKSEFTVITVEPKAYDPAAKYAYAATVDGAEYTGDFTLHPFGESYSAEIPHTAAAGFTVTVTSGQTADNVELKSVVTEDMIGCDKAFEIALNKLSKQIKSLGGMNHLDAEAYVRLVANPINNEGGWYWYVAFVNPEKTYAVLIHPVTMEIAAIRD